MRRILVTNDDGIEADGIIRLAKAAQKYGEVWVIAPESQRGAMSHSITLRTYIDAYEVPFPVEGVKAFAISGSPADCVRVGYLNLMEMKTDLVLSGINYGYNIGSDTQYSATCGAAMEAVFEGIPAIALSEDFTGIHETTDAYLEEVLDELVEKPLSGREIWNVNFPGCTMEECKGILHDCKLSMNSFFIDRYDEEALPDGGRRFRVNGIRNYEAASGTDFYSIMDNYVTIGKVTNLS